MQFAAGGPGSDAAERTGEVPAALVVAGRGAAATHAGLEADSIGHHQVGAADHRAFGQGEQGCEHRRTGMQHHAAHVGVVIVEDVAHLAVGERRIEQTELQLAAENGRLRSPAYVPQDLDQPRNGRMPAAGKRTADPVENAAARLAARALAEIVKARRRQMAAQRLGQRNGVGLEILIHHCGSMPASRIILVQRVMSALI